MCFGDWSCEDFVSHAELVNFLLDVKDDDNEGIDLIDDEDL